MYKVLIIDDEKPAITAIIELVNWDSYDIRKPLFTASDGRAGLVIMQQVQPEIVFVDMNMPIMDGTQFLKKASVDFPNSKYIIISGFDDFTYAQAALQNGAVDYILKPININDLKRALDKSIKLLNIANSSSDSTTIPNAEACAEHTNPKKAIPLIRKYIDDNYCGIIKIKIFSEKYFASKEYLSKLFKEKYGIGIYEYALSLRMKKAKELIIDGDMQIQEISDYLGFSNNNYFSKAFKNYYGVSPSEFWGTLIKRIETDDSPGS